MRTIFVVHVEYNIRVYRACRGIRVLHARRCMRLTGILTYVTLYLCIRQKTRRNVEI